jgi:hypothetical protein
LTTDADLDDVEEMDETPPRTQPWHWAALAGALVLIGGIAVATGMSERGSGPAKPAPLTACQQAQAAYAQEPGLSSNSDYVIIDSPSCFSPTQVANARSSLDAIAIDRAQIAAATHPAPRMVCQAVPPGVPAACTTY